MTIEHKFFSLPRPFDIRDAAEAERAIQHLVDDGWELMQVLDGAQPLALCRRQIPVAPVEVDRSVPDDKEYRQSIKDALRPGMLGKIRKAVETVSGEDLDEARDHVEQAHRELLDAYDLLDDEEPALGDLIALFAALASCEEPDDEGEDDEDDEDDEDEDDR